MIENNTVAIGYKFDENNDGIIGCLYTSVIKELSPTIMVECNKTC